MARWFTIALGLVGWGALLGLEPLRTSEPSHTSMAWVALFGSVVLASRALAFRPAEGSVLSLDSAYYVSAAICVGPLEAGRLTALALTADAVVRLVLATRASSRRRGIGIDDLAYVVYFGGMSGAVVAVMGRLLGAGAAPSHAMSTSEVVARVAGIGTALLATHYALQGIRQRLLGRSWRAYVRRQAVPGIVAELALLPLGVVLVLLYDPAHPVGFVLLSSTYVFINLVFSRLSQTRAQLERRVRGLEILDGTARRLAASLQLEELIEAVARETCRAIPEADAVALVHRRTSDGATLVLDGYDRASDRFTRRAVRPGEGATGWVMQHGVSRRIDDLANADVAAGDTHGVRSWLGVPLYLYGACEGVVAVQAARRAAFRAEHERLLESLALQISAALQNAHLYELAMVDGLTGLFMRRYFDARIEEEVQRSRRYATPFSVIMMDVDDFKKLNDEHGHLVGDRVLRSIANVVKSQMRGVDTAARYGGEEIALILPRTDQVAAYNVGERIREAVRESRFVADGEPPAVLAVTASLGVASFPECGAVDGEDLVRRADRALYRAKRAGKDRVELSWSDDPRADSVSAQEAPRTA